MQCSSQLEIPGFRTPGTDDYGPPGVAKYGPYSTRVKRKPGQPAVDSCPNPGRGARRELAEDPHPSGMKVQSHSYRKVSQIA